MPSSITHAYLAQDIFKRLDKKIINKLGFNALENYKTYAQGPDILYFYNIVFPITKKSRDIIKLGSTCHNEKVNELFVNLSIKVKLSKDYSEFLFLIGLLTHYIADTTIHPFVNYQASQLVQKHLTIKDNHFIMETYLDNYLINKREKVDYKTFKVHQFCFNLERNNRIVLLLNESFREIFGIKRVGNAYFKALKDMKSFFFWFRYDPYKFKRNFYDKFNKLAKRVFRDVRYLSYNFPLYNDDFYLNLSNNKWFNILDKTQKSNLSFPELYDEVVLNSIEKIELLYQYIFEKKKIDLEKLFENKSYGTGLKIK